MAEPTPKLASPNRLGHMLAILLIVAVWFSIIGLTTSLVTRYRKVTLSLPSAQTNDQSSERLYILLAQWGE